MKRITETEAFGELASARDCLGEIYNQLHQFSMKARGDDTPEGRMLALALCNIQLQLCSVQKQLADMAACYH